MTAKTGDLAAFAIEDGRVRELPLT